MVRAIVPILRCVRNAEQVCQLHTCAYVAAHGTFRPAEEHSRVARGATSAGWSGAGVPIFRACKTSFSSMEVVDGEAGAKEQSGAVSVSCLVLELRGGGAQRAGVHGAGYRDRPTVNSGAPGLDGGSRALGALLPGVQPNAPGTARIAERLLVQ